jgi:DNA mismatch repair protein MutS2
LLKNDSILTELEFDRVLTEISKYCNTNLAKNLINELSPLSNKDSILRESLYVTEAKEILIEQDDPPIEYLADLKESIQRCRVDGALIQIEQIKEILKLAQISRKLYSYLKNYADDTNLAADHLNTLFIDKVFEHSISRIFTDSGDIRDNASEKLLEIRKEIQSKSEQLRKSVNRILKRLSDSMLVQDEYVTLRDGRIVVPIKSEHKRQVRGFIHSESATGQTVYIEPEETLELNNEILSLSFAEKREIEKILKQISEKIGTVSYELIASLETVAKLDSIFAKAKYSTEIIGTFPSLEENKPFEILNGRHPLLLKKIKRENTVPLNVKLKNQNVILITGPNAGGKTVVLKSLGLFSLMIQSGLHIPADADSNFRIFDNILMDIGDRQSIEDDLSTFSSHLTNIRNILSEVTENSLVLIDEIGTGTDPAEGAALAAAILITLREANATVFATTHHGNLKLVANELDGFQNSSMLFDSEELRPTYLFSQGMPGSSYAFEVAKRIGLSDELLQLAKDNLDTNKTKVEEFLLELEKKSNDLKEKLSFYERENVRLKGLMNLYSDKVDKLEKEKKVILAETKKQAEEYLNDVNKKVESVIKNIKESKADKQIVKEERQKIAEVKLKASRLIEKEVPVMKNREPLKVGDEVKIIDTETAGKLIEIDKDRAVILAGAIKVRSKLNRLERTKIKKIEKSEYSGYSAMNSVSGLRLDIRGKKPEDVQMEVIKYLDEAYSNSVQSVEILHGKGTGVLKKTVHDILDKHEAVKDHKFAKVEFGGEGITIVNIK